MSNKSALHTRWTFFLQTKLKVQRRSGHFNAKEKENTETNMSDLSHKSINSRKYAFTYILVVLIMLKQASHTPSHRL